MSAQQISAFVASLEKILTTQSKAPAHANLVYNLCAVLMAYTYTIRHLDISSLIGATETHIHDPSYQENLLKPAPDFTLPGFKPLRDDVDDDEPPPLEPDEPISSITSVRQTAANDDPTSSSKSRSPEHAAIAEAALDNLTRLVPFLFALPSSPPDSAPSLAGGQDPSKLLLHSLDDVSMWLLSRLSLDSELGSGGADALNLQLFQDLERLLTAEQLVPTFSIGEEVELEHRLASKLSSLPPQQAFAAAQTPLLINAVADLYSFFGRLITIAARPGSVLSEMRASVKGIKLAHRKVAFYLCSAIQAGCATSTRTSSTLRQEVQHHIQRLERRIDATAQADKLAAAISLLNKGDPLTST
nr:conserved hypothetical protein [Melanopsichium pennsylvanicum 4]